MPISKADVLIVKLNRNEILYCSNLANERVGKWEKEAGDSGWKARIEDPDGTYAKEFATYAVCKLLFGLTPHCWGSWLLRRVVQPGVDLPPSNMIVHASKMAEAKKLSAHKAMSDSAPNKVHVLCACDFDYHGWLATVYILGWTSKPNTELSVETCSPLPPINWEWARNMVWRLDEVDKTKQSQEGSKSCPQQSQPKGGEQP